MSATVATAESFSRTLSEMARRNAESTLAACDQFRRWHREHFISKRPTREQVSEHATNLRVLVLTLRSLQATLADIASPPGRLLTRVETMIRLLEDCRLSVHEPMDEADAEKLLTEIFPE